MASETRETASEGGASEPPVSCLDEALDRDGGCGSCGRPFVRRASASSGVSDGRTHHADCYTSHHDCAIREVERLRASSSGDAGLSERGIQHALDNIPLSPLSDLLATAEYEVRRWRRDLDVFGDSNHGSLKLFVEHTVRPRLATAEAQADALRRVIQSASSGVADSETREESARLLEKCASDYELSAVACDSPLLARYREERTQRAASLRALAATLRSPS